MQIHLRYKKQTFSHIKKGFIVNMEQKKLLFILIIIMQKVFY